MTRPEDIVLLDSAGSEVEAGWWKQALENAGVRTLVRAGGPGAGAWASAATFDHQVFVRADQLEMARDVLAGALNSKSSLPRTRRSAPRVNRAVVNKVKN